MITLSDWLSGRASRSLTEPCGDVLEQEPMQSGPASVPSNIDALVREAREAGRLDGLAEGLQQLEDVRTIAEVQGRLGLVYMDLGELEAASGFFTQVLESNRELGETSKVANALEFLGLLALYQGTNHVACRHFEESLILLEGMSAPLPIGLVNTWLGIGLVQDGQYERGLSHGLVALSIAEDTSDCYAEGHAHMLLGYSSLLLSRADEASKHLEVSVEIFQQLGQQDELGQAHGYLAYVDLAQDNRHGAQTHIVQALQRASITRTILPILLALSAAARLFVVQEEPELAVEMWTQATAYPMIANSSMMEALAGRFVEPVAELLPQSAVDAAKARSSQRDLHETAEYLLSRLTS